MSRLAIPRLSRNDLVGAAFLLILVLSCAYGLTHSPYGSAQPSNTQQHSIGADIAGDVQSTEEWYTQQPQWYRSEILEWAMIVVLVVIAVAPMTRDIRIPRAKLPMSLAMVDASGTSALHEHSTHSWRGTRVTTRTAASR
jgi:hypothetical protein